VATPGEPDAVSVTTVSAGDSSPPHRADGPVRAGIPEHGRVPRYYAVKVDLLLLVDELGEGTMLPSERDLAQRYGVSRLTLRQAVGELVLEGRLVRRQGSGTFVSRPKFVQPLALVSYTEGVAQPALRAALATTGRYTWLPGREVRDVATGLVRTIGVTATRPTSCCSARAPCSVA
jgi:hypothetical protein